MEAGPYSLIYFFGCQFGGFFFLWKKFKKNSRKGNGHPFKYQEWIFIKKNMNNYCIWYIYIYLFINPEFFYHVKIKNKLKDKKKIKL